MARSDRIQVTVSLPMRVALSMLARRNGITVSTQATMVLRQALDRTISSAAGVAEIKAARNYQSVQGWREDRATERQVEVEYARQVAQSGLAQASLPPAPEGHGTLDHVALADQEERFLRGTLPGER